MKKILHLINDASPHRGGAQKIVELLRETETAKGMHSTIFSCARIDKRTEPGSVVGGIAWPVALVSTILKIRPHVVIIHTRNYLPTLPILKKLIPHIVFYAHANYRSKKLLFKLFKPTRFVAVSASVRNNLESLGFLPDNVVVIHNPIDSVSPSFPDPRSNESINVSYIGSLYHWKGISLLLEHLQHIKADVHLKVVGSGPLEGALEERSKSLPANIKVSFLGYLHDPFNATRDCVINIVPSLEEGFGLVAIESIFHGRTVIYSRIPALTEICGDDRLSFPFDHSARHSFEDAFSAALQLAEYSVPIEVISERSKKVRERFSLSHFQSQYLSQINDLI